MCAPSFGPTDAMNRSLMSKRTRGAPHPGKRANRARSTEEHPSSSRSVVPSSSWPPSLLLLLLLLFISKSFQFFFISLIPTFPSNRPRLTRIKKKKKKKNLNSNRFQLHKTYGYAVARAA